MKLDHRSIAFKNLTLILPCNLWREDPAAQHFLQLYRSRFATSSDLVAAYAFDGLNLLIAAIRQAGLNRARIRDALATPRSYTGATGEIRFDGSGSNTARPVILTLGEIERSRTALVHHERLCSEDSP